MLHGLSSLTPKVVHFSIAKCDKITTGFLQYSHTMIKIIQSLTYHPGLTPVHSLQSKLDQQGAYKEVCEDHNQSFVDLHSAHDRNNIVHYS